YAVGTGAAAAMEAFCCVYYSAFLATALVVGGALLFLTDARARARRTLITLAVVGCATVLVVAPLFGAYMRVHRTRGLTRSTEEIAARSADLATYVSSTSRVHEGLWGGSLVRPRDYLFPGLVAAILAAIAVLAALAPTERISGVKVPRTLVMIYAAIGLVGFAASFGPSGIGGISLYRPLAVVLPILHGLRQTTRFGVLVIFSVSVLSAFGAATLEPSLRRFGAAAPAALAVLMFLDLLVAPLRTDRPLGDALVRV